MRTKRFLAILAVVMLASTSAFAITRFFGSFAQTVTTTAARLEPSSGSKSYESLRCYVTSTTPVYFGGPSVDTTNGYALCSGSSCIDSALTFPAQNVYAVVASGTVGITCGIVK